MLLIALCGSPGSGKSLVQHILQEKWNIQPIDDGRIIRDLVKRAFRLEELDVSTQEGKRNWYDLRGAGGDKDFLTVRQLLGKLANGMETEFGEHIVPKLTIDEYCVPSIHNRFSFGSVRRNQGWFYKEQGGIVVEVKRDLEIHNDFDLYDPYAIDYVLDNSGSIQDLRDQIDNILGPIVLAHPSYK